MCKVQLKECKCGKSYNTKYSTSSAMCDCCYSKAKKQDSERNARNRFKDKRKPKLINEDLEKLAELGE